MRAITAVFQPHFLRNALIGSASASIVIGLALWVAVILFPDDFFLFRPRWLYHPFEQEHLTIARNLAHGGGFTISGEGMDPTYGSEDRGYINGRFVPRSVILPYLIYAPSFLISDDAWLGVTPAFGVLGVIACGLIVHRRTRSVMAGSAAMGALLFTSPYFLAASGLAWENMIAASILLWALWALDAYTAKPSLVRGMVVGVLFAAASNSRADYSAASLMLILVLAAYLVLRRNRLSQSARLGGLAAITLAVAGIGGIFLSNFLVTGDPFHSAYGSAAWQGSASGIARATVDFQPSTFLRLGRLFVWEIGKPALIMLGFGLLAFLGRQRPTAADFVLVPLSLFLLVLHLGRPGLNATNAAVLSSSPPRYLLPFYAAGIIIGISGLYAWLTPLRIRLPMVVPSIMLAAALVSAVWGLREAYGSPGGVRAVARMTSMLRFVHDFSKEHPNALFIGDLDSKAIIVTERTLIPRLAGGNDHVVEVVQRELAAGRDVFIVDDPRHLRNNPLYSGYDTALITSGLDICRVTDGWLLSRVISMESGRALARFTVPADSPLGVSTPVLPAGQSFFLLVEGTFAYNDSGSEADGLQLYVGDARVTSAESAAHRYCARVQGAGEPLTLVIRDTHYQDNSGSLTVTVLPAD